ncbi:MAG: tRNA (N(6)-L-threonylcarbamoyladenosine(37)-C(2))-methylthiotransferase [Candidatus Diapherotrites archaeon]|nr:tRNA (N(6)-L-threonylcarbamoyladenosine(37)-C(2))-methylthiotransferase [Candidatus Diapherotrites archaeon]
MRVFVEGYGCSLNKADTEQIRGFLAANGIRISKTPEKSDAIIINTCAVKKPTETRMLNRIRKLHALAQKKGIALVVFGCLPAINSAAIAQVSREIVQIPPSLEKLAEFLGLPREEFSPCLPQQKENRFVSIIPIARGCLGRCAFCCVRQARGDLKSYSIKEIDARFKQAIKETPEVWLTGQDCGCYGADIGASIVELLRELLSNKGDFRVRVGMINPQRMLKFLDEYLPLFEDERLYRFFHIPLQSGSNAVLKAMNRNYTKEDFLFLVKQIRKKLPDATIATDVIAGFPGETEAQFGETASVLRAVQPDVVNVSKFGARPGTVAAKMPCQVGGREVKRRSKALAVLCRQLSLERNKRLVGTAQRILVAEKGKKGGFVGRSLSYKHVVVQKNLLGKFAGVKIKRAFATHLFGSPLKE